ncbi:unnamed protein product [Dicrocoelium dendriticum]|nr:unnamed protein product [Dicrocoelium dendriticum]
MTSVAVVNANWLDDMHANHRWPAAHGVDGREQFPPYRDRGNRDADAPFAKRAWMPSLRLHPINRTK